MVSLEWVPYVHRVDCLFTEVFVHLRDVEVPRALRAIEIEFKNWHASLGSVENNRGMLIHKKTILSAACRFYE